MIITSFQEELLNAPANPTSAWNNPFGAVQYGASIPVGFGGLGAIVFNKGRAVRSFVLAERPGQESGGISGLGQVNLVTGAVGAGLSIAQMIGSFLQPNQTGIFAQDATTLVNGLVAELQEVDSALRSNPTCANQAAAIQFFWTAWNQLVTGCAQLGGPGTKCVNERAQGGKYSWWTYFLQPWQALRCTNPTVNSSDVTGTTNVTTGGSSFLSDPLVLGLLAIGAYAIFAGRHN